MRFVKKPSKFVNLILWTLVQDVLNGVAADMVDVGAVYVNTDGYILPDDRLAAGFDVLNDWGLTGTIKNYGEAHVVSIGTYCFKDNYGDRNTGTKMTENYRRNPNRLARGMNKIDKNAAEIRQWLRPRFSKFGHFAQSEWERFEK